MALSNLPHRTLTIAWLLAGGLQASACFSSSDAEPSAARQAGILPSRTGTSPGKPTPHDVKLADTSPQDVDNPTWERADAQAQSEENDSAAVDPSVDVDPSVGLDVTSTACGTPDAGPLVATILNDVPVSMLVLTAPPVELPPEVELCELHTSQLGVGMCSSQALCDRVRYGSTCVVLEDGTWNCSCSQDERPASAANQFQFSVTGGDSTLCAAAIVPCLPGRGPDEGAWTCEVPSDDSSHWTRHCTSQFDVANFTATAHRYQSVTCDGANCFCPDRVAGHYVFADACLPDRFASTAEYCAVDVEFPPPREDDCGLEATSLPVADALSCAATFACESEVSWGDNAPALRVTNGYGYCDRGSEDEPWSCQCSFDNGPLEFDVLPAQDPPVDAQTCMDAFDLCRVLEENHKDGDVTCKHAAWQFDAGVCTARADCVQPATALGRELMLKGSVGADCTEYDAGRWACTCRGAREQQTRLDISTEGQEAQACEQAIIECTKRLVPVPLPD